MTNGQVDTSKIDCDITHYCVDQINEADERQCSALKIVNTAFRATNILGEYRQRYFSRIKYLRPHDLSTYEKDYNVFGYGIRDLLTKEGNRVYIGFISIYDIVFMSCIGLKDGGRLSPTIH